jgi:hypothetical protein
MTYLKSNWLYLSVNEVGCVPDVENISQWRALKKQLGYTEQQKCPVTTGGKRSLIRAAA